jgi:hypothetical protein
MLAGLGTVLATASRGRTGDPVTIRFGFANVGVDNRQFSGGNFLAVAHADHYIDNELKDLPGVKVEYTFFKGAGPAVNEAFANDQLDFASQGDLPQIIARANGLKTCQLAAGGAHAPLCLAVPPDSDIHTIKDLKGRKVALFRGTNYHLAAVKVLAANGMTERDFQGINMDEASANAALATRNVRPLAFMASDAADRGGARTDLYPMADCGTFVSTVRTTFDRHRCASGVDLRLGCQHRFGILHERRTGHRWPDHRWPRAVPDGPCHVWHRDFGSGRIPAQFGRVGRRDALVALEANMKIRMRRGAARGPNDCWRSWRLSG